MRKKLVLKAHVKGDIRWRGKRLTSFTRDILRTAVIVTQGIFDLFKPLAPVNTNPNPIPFLNDCPNTNPQILKKHTCILTICPSPFTPSTIAVTTTN